MGDLLGLTLRSPKEAAGFLSLQQLLAVQTGPVQGQLLSWQPYPASLPQDLFMGAPCVSITGSWHPALPLAPGTSSQ